MDIKRISIKLREDKKYLVPLCIYMFLFLFFCSKMSPLYPVNEWGDINVYFNIGKSIFSGMTLYSEIFDHKGPLIFFIYGLGALVSGSSFIGVFVLQLLSWLTAATAAFYTARLYISKLPAFIIALLLPFSFLTYMYTGGSAEEMILLFSVVSMYLFIKHFKDGKTQHPPRYMFVHGVLSCMALLIKINLVLFWFFPLLAIFIGLLINREYKNFLQNSAAYISGVSLILAPVLLYFICNGALSEAYHVYIELNKQYSSTDDYAYLLTNGLNKLYKAYRSELVWYIIITTGIFYFPAKWIKGRLNQAAIGLSGVVLFLIIFFPLTFHFYYPLPLLIFVTLGLISIFAFLEQYITVKETKKLIYFILIFILLAGINKQNFFNLGADQLLRKGYENEPQFVFKDQIMKENSPTLLNIAFGEGNALFTTTGLTPHLKYFFSPNIYYNMYPEIRDSQSEYIINKETMFIVDCTDGFNYDFFQTFAPLKENYTLTDSTTVSGGQTYYLYKRKN